MTAAIDERDVQQCAERILGAYVEAMLVLMIDLAQRTGLLDALAEGPATSDALADRAGLAERYVRECLGSLVTGGLVGYDASTREYALPAAHAPCLTGAGATNLAPLSQIPTLLAGYVGDVTAVMRDGGGIPYEAFRPGFTAVMDAASRAGFDDHLLDAIVPMAPGLAQDLQRGIRVADIGCGTGHSTVLLARAFPASQLVGYDLAADALALGRDEARRAGVTNVAFEEADILDLPVDPPFDAVVAFDAIHDQVDPAGALARVRRALAPGGVLLMMDIKAASRLEDNVANPLAPMLYSISTLHCLTVSLAADGAGLGTVWGEERARAMLAEAGFTDVAVHDVPDDPLNQVYVARTRSG